MYQKFFRLKKNPFKLAPNPDYLYLGSGHEEALAHLKYGISQGEGFISITGMPGVGPPAKILHNIDLNSLLWI